MVAEAQTMIQVNTVIIGGGQAGLAMSRSLLDRNIPRVILEQGRVAERWCSERWDSLRLLTPNWMTRLPGEFHYRGDDPDGFMTAAETLQFFQDYADSFDAPIQTHTKVVSVERSGDDLCVTTSKGTEYKAQNVVIATGFCDKARVPEYAKSIPSTVVQLGPSDYHRPNQFPRGSSVLIVGASATGCQIAEELMESKRFDKIYLSVGRHTRLPRRYRGKDTLYWLDAIGFFDAPCEASKEREAPAPQIIGTPENVDLDLAILQSHGVELIGHAADVKKCSDGGATMAFANDLNETVSAADAKLLKLLEAIDQYIEKEEIQAPLATSIDPVSVPSNVARGLDLREVHTVIWATGYSREYPFLQQSLPSLLDENGDVRQDHGVTPEQGVYVLGMRFEMTRISNFIDGVGADAEVLADQISEGHLSSLLH